MAKLIPVLRNDAPLIINKLMILRQGLSEENEYTIFLDNNTDSYQAKFSYRYWFGYQSYYIAEKPEEFSAEKIDAINYLLLSNELQLNASSIHISLRASPSLYAVFARSDDYWFALGIYYLDPDNNRDTTSLNMLRQLGDYVEELESNYWLVMWFVERH